MSNSLAHRDPATLIAADFEDRRRIAQTELVMRLEETNGDLSPIGFGQTMLAHSLEGDLDDVVALTDKVRKRMHI